MQLDPDRPAQQGEDAALLRTVDRAFSDHSGQIAVAVSGGGDSVALLHLAVRSARQRGREIAAVTVDHGLRQGSRAEAEGVAQLCQSLGVEHKILEWRRRAESGNLSAQARDGRYALMAQWAQGRGISSLMLGHTLDDSAENFLMRLGRAAGLDGLARMAQVFERGGVHWARPLIEVGRADLRSYLRRHGVAWVDDPSNDDPRYLRSQARQMLPQLAAFGVSAQSLSQTAAALRQSREALEHYLRLEASRFVTQEAGDLLISAEFEQNMPGEMARRLSLAALRWVGGRGYAPRGSFTGRLGLDLAGQDRMSVAGCLIMRRKGAYRITREHNAVKDLVTPTDIVWDERWRMEGPHARDLEVRALGESVNDVPDWRATGLPRATLTASPAVWRGDTLIAVPLAGYNQQWSAQIVADFTSFLDSH